MTNMEDSASIGQTGRLSLGQKERLRRNGQFQDVYLRGLKQQGPNLTLYYKPNHLFYNRLGISIAKKYLRLSSKRHSIRRCLREAFRINKQQFLRGYDLVITLRKFSFFCLEKSQHPPAKKFTTLKNELLCLAQKAGLLQ